MLSDSSVSENSLLLIHETVNTKRTPDNLENKMKIDKYLGRGIHKKQFLDSLTSGKLQPMLKAIKKDYVKLQEKPHVIKLNIGSWVLKD